MSRGGIDGMNPSLYPRAVQKAIGVKRALKKQTKKLSGGGVLSPLPPFDYPRWKEAGGAICAGGFRWRKLTPDLRATRVYSRRTPPADFQDLRKTEGYRTESGGINADSKVVSVRRFDGRYNLNEDRRRRE